MRTLYVILDNQAQDVGRLAMIHNSDAAAVREFTDLLQDQRGLPGKHPEDFDLLRIAQLDETTGEVTPILRTAMVVTTGRAFKALQAQAAERDAAELYGDTIKAVNS